MRESSDCIDLYETNVQDTEREERDEGVRGQGELSIVG